MHALYACLIKSQTLWSTCSRFGYNKITSFIAIFSYPKAIAMVASGKVAPLLMVTHCYVLRDLLTALELITRRQEGVLKVMIQCDA